MLKRTPLYPIYEQYGAKTIDFGGWDLPVQFTAGIHKEHDAVRKLAGLFDVSHMGQVLVSGTAAMGYLQNLLTNDVSKLQVNQAQYSLMCYPDGGVVDDLLVYKLDAEKYMLVINAANIAKDLDWLDKHIEDEVAVENISDATALIAIQGPLSAKILAKLTAAPIAELKSFHFLQDVSIGSSNALISRTGYTGEDGFELYLQRDEAVNVWEQVMSAGAPEGMVPAGLGARDTLRFEAKLPLYGQELSAHITPIEAGLGYFVSLDKGPFIGREHLEEQKINGAGRKLVGVEMVDRGIPRPHYPVFAVDGKPIGEITTGTQSPTFKTNIGLALIKTAYAALHGEVLVEIRGKPLKAIVVRSPFYKRAKLTDEDCT